MATREEMVKDFHEAFGHPIDESWEPDLVKLRLKLIGEEFFELYNTAMDLINMPYEGVEEDLLKEMADLQYVLSGMAVALGLDLDQAFRRVHLSNLTKLGSDGKPIYREDGKVLKGPNYIPPYLKDLVT